jgi:hypothetical protein
MFRGIRWQIKLSPDGEGGGMSVDQMVDAAVETRMAEPAVPEVAPTAEPIGEPAAPAEPSIPGTIPKARLDQVIGERNDLRAQMEEYEARIAENNRLVEEYQAELQRFRQSVPQLPQQPQYPQQFPGQQGPWGQQPPWQQPTPQPQIDWNMVDPAIREALANPQTRPAAEAWLRTQMAMVTPLQQRLAQQDQALYTMQQQVAAAQAEREARANEQMVNTLEANAVSQFKLDPAKTDTNEIMIHAHGECSRLMKIGVLNPADFNAVNRRFAAEVQRAIGFIQERNQGIIAEHSKTLTGAAAAQPAGTTTASPPANDKLFKDNRDKFMKGKIKNIDDYFDAQMDQVKLK